MLACGTGPLGRAPGISRSGAGACGTALCDSPLRGSLLGLADLGRLCLLGDVRRGGLRDRAAGLARFGCLRAALRGTGEGLALFGLTAFAFGLLALGFAALVL